MVVLLTVCFFLSSYLSIFLSTCEELHWKYVLDFAVFLHVARSFFNQSDSGLFKLKHVPGYYHMTRQTD